MTLHAIHVKIELSEINCGICGGVYAINERYRNQKEVEGGGWCCPYCQCDCGYFGETKEQLLEKQLEIQKRSNKFLREQNEKERNRTRAEKAAKTRIKNRIKNGVCPCCNRTFKNIHDHMKTKHPDYVKEKQ